MGSYSAIDMVIIFAVSAVTIYCLVSVIIKIIVKLVSKETGNKYPS